MDSQYRALLPSDRRPPEPAEQRRTLPPVSPRRTRPSITRVACDACRARKSACDGVRPVCATCRARATDCVYMSKNESETRTMALKRNNAHLTQRLSALDELFAFLRDSPDDVAGCVLARLRGASDPASVLQSIRHDLELVHPSPPPPQQQQQQQLRAKSEEKELELAADHAAAAYSSVSLSTSAQSTNPLSKPAKMPPPNDAPATPLHSPSLDASPQLTEPSGFSVGAGARIPVSALDDPDAGVFSWALSLDPWLEDLDISF